VSQTRVLLATGSPVVCTFFAALGRDGPLSFTVDSVPVASAEATVAVVDTDASADESALIAFCATLHTQRPALPVVALVYTSQAITPWHIQALLGGQLRGILDLRATEDEIRLSLAGVARGSVAVHVRFDPEHASVLSQALIRPEQLSNTQPGRDQFALSASPSILTKREREVVGLPSAGAHDKEVAARLGVTISTVESHVRTAAAKLGAKTRVHLGVRAAQHALVPPLVASLGNGVSNANHGPAG
jgi:DNA-binding NarL/FixJ family response regulator